MTPAAHARLVARYGLPWAAELADWLIRWQSWRAAARIARDGIDPFYDNHFFNGGLHSGTVQRRAQLMEVLDYLRATRPERN